MNTIFSKKEIKSNLIGCLEVFLFMSRGIDRFSDSRIDAIKSFLISVFVLPLSLFVLVALSEGYSANLLFFLHTVRIVITTVLFLTIVYFLIKQYERQAHFYRFMTIVNWMNIPGIILCLPIMSIFVTGADPALFENYGIFVTILGYIYAAFIITHTFRLPWEMGGFIAILALAIDQNALELTVHIRDSLS